MDTNRGVIDLLTIHEGTPLGTAVMLIQRLMVDCPDAVLGEAIRVVRAPRADDRVVEWLRPYVETITADPDAAVEAFDRAAASSLDLQDRLDVMAGAFTQESEGDALAAGVRAVVEHLAAGDTPTVVEVAYDGNLTCPLCDHEFKGEQGLRTHLSRRHDLQGAGARKAERRAALVAEAVTRVGLPDEHHPTPTPPVDRPLADTPAPEDDEPESEPAVAEVPWTEKDPGMITCALVVDGGLCGEQLVDEAALRRHQRIRHGWGQSFEEEVVEAEVVDDDPFANPAATPPAAPASAPRPPQTHIEPHPFNPDAARAAAGKAATGSM